MQLVGLKAVYAGEPLPKGVKDEEALALMKAYKRLMQPYKGGVSTNFSNPTATKFYREGESNPFAAIFDPTTGEKKLSWMVADFDDEDKELEKSTMTFYFGEKEPDAGELYEGEKGFVFVTETGHALAFARLKFAATLSGGLNTSDPMQIAVEAEVLAPTGGGRAWWPIASPYTDEELSTND